MASAHISSGAVLTSVLPRYFSWVSERLYVRKFFMTVAMASPAPLGLMNSSTM